MDGVLYLFLSLTWVFRRGFVRLSLFFSTLGVTSILYILTFLFLLVNVTFLHVLVYVWPIGFFVSLFRFGLVWFVSLVRKTKVGVFG